MEQADLTLVVVDCGHLPRGPPGAAAAFLYSYLRGVLPPSSSSSSSSSSSQENTGTTPALSGASNVGLSQLMESE